MPDRPSHHEPAPDADAVGRRIRDAALTVEAPPRLRDRVGELRRAAEAPDRSRRRSWRLPAAALGAATALAVALLLAVGLPGGGAADPSVDDAAALALSRPTAPAPALDASDQTRVRAQVDGVAFPNYTYAWPRWRTVGARQDRIDGRDATTVVYRGPLGDVGYTIVAGEPLAEPEGARYVSAGGLRLAVVRRDGATVVTWRRDGHTCVLAGRGPGVERQLVRFATWA